MNKTCPKCFTSHNKKGIFCSRICANARVFSPEANKKRAETLKRLADIRGRKVKPSKRSIEEIRQETKDKFDKGEYINHGAIYNILVERFGNVCTICNLPGVRNNQPLKLRVDHIDGNPYNYEPSNFRLVCPNCDSQLPTFAGRNHGKGRKSRSMGQLSEDVSLSS